MPTLSEILGMGYHGAAKIGGTPVLMSSSSASANDSLLKSQGAFSNLNPFAAGEPPARNRRKLEVSLTCTGTWNSVQLALLHTLTFRTQGANASAFTAQIYLANGEGFNILEGYLNAATISAQENANVQVTLNIVSYLWDDVFAVTGSPRNQQIINSWNDPNLQPIPFWLTTCSPSSPVNSTTMGWSLTLGNNYTFGALCENTVYPPTPRVVVADRLQAQLSVTSLARPGARPEEIGSAALVIGGGDAGPNTVAPTTVTFPQLVRDTYSAQALGDTSTVTKWQTTWNVIMNIPTVT